jgi:ferrous iron transport protein A
MASSPGSPPNPSPASLNDVPVGQRVRIASLPSHDVLRERLWALGIRPGVVVQVVRRGRPGGILHLAHGPLEFMLRRDQAAEIAVGGAETSGDGRRPQDSLP